MGELYYKPLIEEMKWSYSRVASFDSCPYRWFLKYIKHYRDRDKFYATYGSFMHKLLEKYYKGELNKNEMQIKFLTEFKKEVRGLRPKKETVEKYIKQGSDYLRSFEPLPFNVVAIEKEVKFEIDGIPFIGFIDFLGEKDGEYYIVDNKSRDMKPRSNRAKPTVKDRELDDMLKQLYIYSVGVYQEYGKYPKELCFNCFRTNTLIREPFKMEAFEEAVEWAKEKIREIENVEDFEPKNNYFFCKYICGVDDHCIYEE